MTLQFFLRERLPNGDLWVQTHDPDAPTFKTYGDRHRAAVQAVIAGEVNMPVGTARWAENERGEFLYGTSRPMWALCRYTPEHLKRCLSLGILATNPFK